jgi:hypothetical protein
MSAGQGEGGYQGTLNYNSPVLPIHEAQQQTSVGLSTPHLRSVAVKEVKS